jgi:hypothetical protein
MATTIPRLGYEPPIGERAHPDAAAHRNSGSVRRGPRRRPLAELLRLTGDPALFADHPEGHRLVADRQELARHLGITRQSLWGRITRLLDDGLAGEHGRDLVLYTDRIRERLTPTVVPIRTEATRQFHDAMAGTYTPAAAADGTLTYLCPDGRTATLRDMSNAMGWRSRGSAHHHMGHLVDPEPSAPRNPDRPDVDETYTAIAQALDSAAQLVHIAGQAGHHDLVTAAARFADELMRITTRDLSRDVNVDARHEPRHDVALRDQQRDANASLSRSTQEPGLGLDGNSIPPIRDPDNAARQRDPQRDNETGDEPPALWEAGEWPDLLRPLQKAWYSRHNKPLPAVQRLTIDRARQRPRTEIASAVNRLAAQVLEGVDIRDASAVLGAAIRDGHPDYFPPSPSEPDLAQFLAEDAEQIAADVAGQAGTDLHLAAYLIVARAGHDQHLLRTAITATRTRLDDPHDELLAHVLDQLDPDQADALTNLPPEANP